MDLLTSSDQAQGGEDGTPELKLFAYQANVPLINGAIYSEALRTWLYRLRFFHLISWFSVSER